MVVRGRFSREMIIETGGSIERAGVVALESLLNRGGSCRYWASKVRMLVGEFDPSPRRIRSMASDLALDALGILNAFVRMMALP